VGGVESVVESVCGCARECLWVWFRLGAHVALLAKVGGGGCAR